MRLCINTFYSQRDPKWANKLLGFNTDKKYTIEDYGCLITTLAMYLTALGKKETPDTLNEKLKKLGSNVGFLAGSGLFIWDSLSKVTPGVTLYYASPRWDGVDTPKEAINSIKDMIKNGYFVVIEVDFDPATAGKQPHFVGGCGVEDDGEIMVADPWTGTLLPLSSYGKPANIVYSFKVYTPTIPEEKKPEEYPEYKVILWRAVRVFVAGAIGALTVTVLTTAFDFELTEALKYVGTVGITGGLTALSKYLRDKYGDEGMSSLIHKLLI